MQTRTKWRQAATAMVVVVGLAVAVASVVTDNPWPLGAVVGVLLATWGAVELADMQAGIEDAARRPRPHDHERD